MYAVNPLDGEALLFRNWNANTVMKYYARAKVFGAAALLQRWFWKWLYSKYFCDWKYVQNNQKQFCFRMGFPCGSAGKECVPAMWETWVWSLGREGPLENDMATQSSTLAWKISWTEEPGRLQPMGLQRVRHDWATSLLLSFLLDYQFFGAHSCS